MVRHETGGVKSAVDRTARIGTSTDDVRRRNLSGVLTLVHRHRCMSRAELTRRTGLSRSTASTTSTAGRVATPNGSAAVHPTVHSPKENLSDGCGINPSAAGMLDSRTDISASSHG